MVIVLINPDVPLIRAVILIPIGLFATGYALTSAALSNMELDSVSRIYFSIGTNICLLVIGGVLLNRLPSGQSRITWITFLVVITLVASIITLVRRSPNETPPSTPNTTGKTLNISSGVQFLAALILVIGAYGIATAGVRYQPEKAFTQFWVIPAESSDGHEYLVGIQNMEQKPLTYTIRITSGSESVLEWSDITLESGERWENSLSFDDSWNPRPLTLTLHLAETPDQVYRRLVVYNSGLDQASSQLSNTEK